MSTTSRRCPGPGLIVSTATIAAKHDAVAGVRPRDAPGDERDRRRPDEGPRRRDRRGAGARARIGRRRQAILDATIAAWQPPGIDADAVGLGAIDRDGWQASIDYMTKLGLVPNPVTVDGLVDRGVPSDALSRRLSSAACPAVDLPGSAAVRDPRPDPDAARRGRHARTSRTGSSWSTPPVGSGTSAASRARRRRRLAAAVDLRPWVVLPGLVDTHAHLPQLPNAGLGLRARPVDLARPADVPDRAVVGRPGGRRAAGAGDLPGVRRGRDDDGARLRRRLRGGDGRRVPGGRGARDPGDPRQGDDGSGHVRPDDRAVDDPRALAARVRVADRALARRGRRAARLRGDAAIRRLVHGRAAARVGGPGAVDRRWWQSHVSEDRGEIAEVARYFPEAQRLRRRLRPGGRARRADRPRPRDPPVRSRSWRGSSRPGRASRTARPRTCSSGRG